MEFHVISTVFGNPSEMTVFAHSEEDAIGMAKNRYPVDENAEHQATSVSGIKPSLKRLRIKLARMTFYANHDWQEEIARTEAEIAKRS